MQAVDLRNPRRQRLQLRPLHGEELARHRTKVLLVCGVDLVAPLPCLLIQIFPTGEGPPGEEVSFDKAEWPLHASGAISMTQFVSRESEPEAVAEGLHLRHGDHLAS